MPLRRRVAIPLLAQTLGAAAFHAGPAATPPARPDSAAVLLAPDSSLIAGTFKVEIAPWSTVYEGAITR